MSTGLFNPEVLARLIYEMPERAGLSLRELATRVGKPPSTLAREMNPDDDGAKLGLRDFVYATAETRDFEPLDYVESALGRVAFELPRAVPGQEAIILALGRSGRECGEMIDQIATDVADGRLDDPARALREIDDLARVLAQLRVLVIATDRDKERTRALRPVA